jgi:hypothetical protein
MLLYGSYMSVARLKWRCLLFLSTLFCFDIVVKLEPHHKSPSIKLNVQLEVTTKHHHNNTSP